MTDSVKVLFEISSITLIYSGVYSGNPMNTTFTKKGKVMAIQI